ncbi:MAG: hypothetical protein Kow00114_41820 [Kiloniellaceae bacterium]
MSGRRFLKGLAAAYTPPQAKAFYRHPRWRAFDLARAVAAVIDGAPFQLALVDQVFADTLGRFQWRGEGEDVWANWTQKARLIAGRWVRLWVGDCDDFAILLLVALVRAGLPRGALRLCRCEVGFGRRRTGHLVLAVMTARGTLILDNRQTRPLWADDPAFRGYDFLGMEDPPAEPGGAARWVWLRPMTLEELARRVET